MLHDPNNRPGGPNLIVTAKSADKVQFFDAATLTKTGEIDMPASTHEMILSPDGARIFATIYGGGIFGRNSDPDRRIAVIDLAAKSLARTIDVGGNLAPHGIMLDAAGTIWSTAELGECLLAIDPDTGSVERIALGGKPHWVAVSHTVSKVFASFKANEFAVVVDQRTRKPLDRIRIPNLAEGLAVTPDGETVFLAAHLAGEFHVIDARSHAIRQTVKINGAEGTDRQLKRVRVSPDGKFLLISSLLDNHVAIFQVDGPRQIGSIATPKAPMGFGFAADGTHAYVCCHDAAVVLEFEMANGRVTRDFPTAAGCEFIIAYS
ncbi:MAG: beta-propeller fold lactonase family protein [Xanthobacteraceae bacterium]